MAGRNYKLIVKLNQKEKEILDNKLVSTGMNASVLIRYLILNTKLKVEDNG